MSCEIIGLIGPEICLWPWCVHEASEKGRSSAQCFSRHAEARRMREGFFWQLVSNRPWAWSFVQCCPHPVHLDFWFVWAALLWELGREGSRCQLSGHHPRASSSRGGSYSTMCSLQDQSLALPDPRRQSRAVATLGMIIKMLECALTFLWRILWIDLSSVFPSRWGIITPISSHSKHLTPRDL